MWPSKVRGKHLIHSGSTRARFPRDLTSFQENSVFPGKNITFSMSTDVCSAIYTAEKVMFLPGNTSPFLCPRTFAVRYTQQIIAYVSYCCSRVFSEISRDFRRIFVSNNLFCHLHITCFYIVPNPSCQSQEVGVLHERPFSSNRLVV